MRWAMNCYSHRWVGGGKLGKKGQRRFAPP
jgi:hypothetical protein